MSFVSGRLTPPSRLRVHTGARIAIGARACSHGTGVRDRVCARSPPPAFALVAVRSLLPQSDFDEQNAHTLAAACNSKRATSNLIRLMEPKQEFACCARAMAARAQTPLFFDEVNPHQVICVNFGC